VSEEQPRERSESPESSCTNDTWGSNVATSICVVLPIVYCCCRGGGWVVVGVGIVISGCINMRQGGYSSASIGPSQPSFSLYRRMPPDCVHCLTRLEVLGLALMAWGFDGCRHADMFKTLKARLRKICLALSFLHLVQSSLSSLNTYLSAQDCQLSSLRLLNVKDF
jgi:hypothetical protein